MMETSIYCEIYTSVFQRILYTVVSVIGSVRYASDVLFVYFHCFLLNLLLITHHMEKIDEFSIHKLLSKIISKKHAYKSQNHSR